jgi:paraquat-inducible protein B
MSSKRESVAIGAFIVGGIIILVSSLLFISGSGIGKDRQTVVMVFDGSVKGLQEGAPIALRGVEIGQVTDIKLIFDSDSIDLIMLVEAEITAEHIQRRGIGGVNIAEELIGQGLRAQLISQSLLTGLLMIQLDFHPGTPIRLGQVDSPYIQIPTIPTDLERFTRQVESIDFAQVASDLQTTVAGLRQLTNSESLQRFPTELDQIMRAMHQLAERLDSQLAVSGPKFDQLLETTESAMATVDRQLPPLARSLNDSLARLDSAIRQIDRTAARAGDLIEVDSPTIYRLNKALREIELAGRALQGLVETLEVQPDALLRGKRESE